MRKPSPSEMNDYFDEHSVSEARRAAASLLPIEDNPRRLRAKKIDSTSDALVRALVGDALRSGPWTHALLCHGCLLKLMVARGLAYGNVEVRQALDRIFRNPEDLVYMPAFPCAKCNSTMACLGAK